MSSRTLVLLRVTWGIKIGMQQVVGENACVSPWHSLLSNLVLLSEHPACLDMLMPSSGAYVQVPHLPIRDKKVKLSFGEVPLSLLELRGGGIQDTEEPCRAVPAAALCIDSNHSSACRKSVVSAADFLQSQQLLWLFPVWGERLKPWVIMFQDWAVRGSLFFFLFYYSWFSHFFWQNP